MEQKNISKKILAVMKAVPHVMKDGRNEMQKYDYVRESDVIAVIREQLIAHGLAITTSLRCWNTIEAGQTKSGTRQYLTSIEMEYTLTDADSGESIVAVFPGQGIDSGDKGVYKAMAGAHKYALLKTFHISTGEDDPENDRSQRKTKAAPSRREEHPQSQPAQQKPPDATLADRMRPYASWSEADFLKKIALMEKKLYGDDADLIIKERKAAGVLADATDLNKATKRELFFYYEKLSLAFMRSEIPHISADIEKISVNPSTPKTLKESADNWLLMPYYFDKPENVKKTYESGMKILGKEGL
jgi:hypothetical protein